MKLPKRVTGVPGLFTCWLISRVLMLLSLEQPRFLHVHPASKGDVRLYMKWSETLLNGSFPVHERSWQYPPLAGVVMVAPHVLPFLSYLHAFVLINLLIDLAVLLLLVSRRHAGLAAAWTWTFGIALLGVTAFLRYDMIVTFVSVIALLALPRTRLFGVFTGLGAMLKVWPALLLCGLPRDRRLVSAAIAFVATAVVVLAGGSLLGHSLDFLGHQSGRGMEIEAIAVTPVNVMRMFGLHEPIGIRYGCFQFVGGGIQNIGTACLVATIVGLALVAYLSWRRRPADWTPAFAADVALAATLVSVITSRVLSPQYLIWVIGVAAACIFYSGSRQRTTVIILLIATGLSQLLFPSLFLGLRHSDPIPVLVLVVRNALLLAATILSIRTIWSPPADPRRPLPHRPQTAATG